MQAPEPATATATWQDDNAGYLEAAVAWLRLLLARQAGRLPSRPVDPALPQVTDQEVADAAEAVTAAEQAAAGMPAIRFLGERLGLGEFERNVLLLCVAVELDTRIATLCALAQDDPAHPYPTFALAMAIFEEPAWEALAPDRPLRYWRLVELPDDDRRVVTAPLRADERVVHHAKGLVGHLDERLSALLSPDEGGPWPEPPPSQLAVARAAAAAVTRAAGAGRPAVVQLAGGNRAAVRVVARRAAAELGLRLAVLPLALLPAQPAELDAFCRLWQRESLLLPLALYLDSDDPETGAAGAHARVLHLLARAGGVLFMHPAAAPPGLGHGVVLDVAAPTPAEQEAAWAAGLGPDAGEVPGRLAGQFELNTAEIDLLCAEALEAGAAGSELADRLWQACVTYTRPRIDLLAQRLEPRQVGWGDLVLPERPSALLRQVADQVAQRHTVYQRWGFGGRLRRGLGISVLFAGDSGTGKTMAAEVITAELGLDLYRIDLSQVVSKYIGETEKNLHRLFDAAERGGAVLLFDEADALFGKRSEVRDSHDRYANIEINYLLQRMETYGGLAILATNMKRALDQAFLRRLRFVVEFPFPGPAQRAAIWARAFPPDTPVGALDVDRLARLNLSGGAIALVALNAAFLAAAAGTEVTMAVILEAARGELAKRGGPDDALLDRLDWQVTAG